jgi:hypothetical protein
VPVTLRGSGFREGAVVIAEVEGEARELPADFVSERELRTLVPPDFWSEHAIEVCLVVERRHAAASAPPLTSCVPAGRR